MITSRLALSGSTQGKAVKVAATASPGTTVHTTGIAAFAVVSDEIWVWAFNSDSVTRTLVLQFGGTTSPDNDIKVDIPPQQGKFVVIPGLSLSGDGASGLSLKAYCATANVLTLTGHVNRITN